MHWRWRLQQPKPGDQAEAEYLRSFLWIAALPDVDDSMDRVSAFEGGWGLPPIIDEREEAHAAKPHSVATKRCTLRSDVRDAEAHEAGMLVTIPR